MILLKNDSLFMPFSWTSKSACILLVLINFINPMHINAQDKVTVYHPSADSISAEDTTQNNEIQEDSYQDFIDTLYQANQFNAISLDGWDNKMINAGHFDSKNMRDTVQIILRDSDKQVYFCSPFKNYVTSGFGPRRYMFHFGMDIKLQIGDSVEAAMDGIVRVTKYDRRGFGNVVVLRHPKGLETIYGHLSKVLVTTNQMVKAGTVIGLGGNSGRSTGSHLHFETRYQGEPFDPSCFYDFDNFDLKHDTLTLTRSNFEYLIELRKAQYYTIRKGDTMGRIARMYNTTIQNICKLNHFTPKTMLRVGRKIRVN